MTAPPTAAAAAGSPSRTEPTTAPETVATSEPSPSEPLASVPEVGGGPEPASPASAAGATPQPVQSPRSPDPLDAELRGLNDALNGIDSSLSGAGNPGDE